MKPPAPLDEVSWIKACILAALLFVVAYAWVYSLGTSRPPSDDVWSPATVAPPVTVTIPRSVP